MPFAKRHLLKYLLGLALLSAKPALAHLSPAEGVLDRIPDFKTAEDINFESPNKLSRRQVLKDSKKRLSAEWDIPSGLYSRTAFWLNVYSRYSSDYNIIHNKDFPWIIYSVVSVDDLRRQSMAKHLRQRELRARTNKEIKRLKTIFQNLSSNRISKKRKNSSEYKRIAQLLAKIPGKQKRVHQKAIDSLRVQLGQKDFFRAGLINSQRYLNSMEQIFKGYGLPTELTRLPLVESSFNENAMSKHGASGVWQLMPAIGRHYLQVNERIDERNSPLKATGAAAQLLRENYLRLKSWPLAVTAYNHGAGSIARAVRKVESTELKDIITGYQKKSFGFASENFYCEFLAALYAEKYQKELFGDLPKPPPIDYAEVKLENSSALSLEQLSSLTQLPIDSLLNHNLDLKKIFENRWSLPNSYTVILPRPHAEKLKESLLLFKDDGKTSL